MTRHASLAAAFAHAKSENRAALIGYLPAGFPNAADSVRLINQMVESGCDIIGPASQRQRVFADPNDLHASCSTSAPSLAASSRA